MPRFAPGILLLALASAAAPLHAQQPAAPPAAGHAAHHAPPEAAVRAVLEAVFRAQEGGDMAALDTLYAGDSLTIIEGAGINRSWADYRDHHLAPELTEMKNLVYRPSDIEVHVDGATAWAIFQYVLQADVEGRHADVLGRGTAVFERRGERWVMRHSHTSGRARRPGDPPAG